MEANKYWNGNGEAQELYKEMVDNHFKFSKTAEKLFHSYYRYYNDGDIPRWAVNKGMVHTAPVGYCHYQRIISADGEIEFERIITERIKDEYKRFQKSMHK